MEPNFHPGPSVITFWSLPCSQKPKVIPWARQTDKLCTIWEKHFQHLPSLLLGTILMIYFLPMLFLSPTFSNTFICFDFLGTTSITLAFSGPVGKQQFALLVTDNHFDHFRDNSFFPLIIGKTRCIFNWFRQIKPSENHLDLGLQNLSLIQMHSAWSFIVPEFFERYRGLKFFKKKIVWEHIKQLGKLFHLISKHFEDN